VTTVPLRTMRSTGFGIGCPVLLLWGCLVGALGCVV
jgi:hypothetical protein